ncbi:unnamed protein product, partial [Allacma fusca]
AKRRRAFYRRQVKVLEKELSELLEQELVDYDGARARLLRMKEAARKISEYDEQIIEGMLDRDEPEEDVDSEQEGIGEYRDLIYRINAYTNRHLEGSSSSTEEIETRNGSTVGKSVPMKFPKLEIRKFCGKLEDWLPWWAQFKSIHESTALNKVEKFQYLVQSLVEGTRAADVVKVYHCTEENYDKAIQALKERCGNEDAITDMLMREIVQLVTSRQKLSLTKLYDQLEGKLHSLESMGRKTKTDCDILYPMVEASFSEDLLRTWKRVQDRYKSDSEHNGESLTKLELLMQFLKEEAQREDEITLTLANVKASSQDRKRKIETIEEESVPTAAGLSTAARVVTSSFKK